MAKNSRMAEVELIKLKGKLKSLEELVANNKEVDDLRAALAASQSEVKSLKAKLDKAQKENKSLRASQAAALEA